MQRSKLANLYEKQNLFKEKIQKKGGISIFKKENIEYRLKSNTLHFKK
jgi:hypothetical protein